MIMIRLIVWQNANANAIANAKTNGNGRNAMINAHRKPKSARMTFFAWINVRNFAICAMKEPVITWTQLKRSSIGSGKQILFNAEFTRRYVKVTFYNPLTGVYLFLMFLLKQFVKTAVIIPTYA